MILDAHLHLAKKEFEPNFKTAGERLLKNLTDNKISGAFVIADNVTDSDCADTNTLIELFGKNNNINNF